MALIEVTGLTKIFYVPQKRPGLVGSVEYLFNPQRLKKVAVDHINLSMEAGESVAYVGPNGAGKSTTIKMLTGILIPTYLNVLKLALSISPSLHFSID
ncbi:MAG: ATP-binding cassette domain-containing protein [Firmicutes bacterium]|nr:ATP-binding cassette domain-containing protein [Bacillota bacterium]